MNKQSGFGRDGGLDWFSRSWKPVIRIKGWFENMKHFTWIILGVSLFIIGCKSDGAGDAISLIAELPNTPEYSIDGHFVDIGIVYNTVSLEGINIFNHSKRWCLFSGKTYWVMDKAQLDEIAAEAGITLPANLDLPFWDEWGGRVLIIGLIVCLIIGYLLWDKFRPKIKTLQPFDGRSTKENAATLLIRACYKVKEYNGSKVNWSSTIASAASILLPPGMCSVVFDYSEKEGDTTHTASNHNATGNLEIGKTYLIKSIRYKNKDGTAMETHIVECNAEEMKKYLSGIYSPVTTKELK